AQVDPHACGQGGRCAAPRGGALRALGRPGGAQVDPHACGQGGRCAAPRGGALRALGRPGGAQVDPPACRPTERAGRGGGPPGAGGAPGAAGCVVGRGLVATRSTSSSLSSPRASRTRSGFTSAMRIPLIVSPCSTRRDLPPAVSFRNAVFLPPITIVPVNANW